MAKHHPSSSPPSASTAHSSPTPPPSFAHLSLQLKQDLALLTHNDPGTRRSSMEALKQFIEGELDDRSMPGFLEQVSWETGKSNGGYAISLFTEVARVHKQATVPFIPRIMAAVLRTLASSSGWANHANNLHQACAKVVAAVARYTIEPSSSLSRASMATDVLDSLCQPLLGLLSSNVEPVAVGSATCLQAVVEAENWKLAAPELVHDVCLRSSISLVEKGKHSIAHMHLVQSLARFSAEALQEHAASLLKVGIRVLVSSGGDASSGGSWQQRAAAAQLLGTIMGCCDPRFLAPELLKTAKALEKCRLDKVATVRQAVGEALLVAKNLVSDVDRLLPHNNGPPINSAKLSSSKSGLPEVRKRATRKKDISRAESCGSTITANDFALTSQEARIVSYVSSPSSSIPSISSSSLRSPSPAPSEKSSSRTGQSASYPDEESPLFVSSVDKYVADADSPNISAHGRFLDLEENSPFVRKGDGGPGLSMSDDITYLLYNEKRKVLKEEYGDESVTNNMAVHECISDLQCNPLMTEGYGESNTLNADACRAKISSVSEWDKFLEVSEKDVILKPEEKRRAGTQYITENEKNVPEHVKMVVENHDTSWKQKKVPCYETINNGMRPEDLLIFSTPRRLVHSLQSVNSTPDSKQSPERDQGSELDCETLSESGWSVRDNPIAGDPEDDSPTHSSVNGQKDMLTRSMEGPPLKGMFYESSTLEENLARCYESPNMRATSANVSLHKAPSGRLKSFIGHPDGLANEISSDCHKGSNKSKEKQLSGSSTSRECMSVLRKVHSYVETFLFCTLLLVLGLAIFITILNWNHQHDFHSLVPT